MGETPELLQQLLTAPRPPATRPRRRRSGARPPPSPSSRPTGSAPRSPASASRRRRCVAVVGHIDEIGLAITHIDEKGFLWFTPIGGWDPQILVGQRVEVRRSDGLVPGVVGRKPIHLLEPDQRKKVVELKGLHIDIGAADRDEALALVRVGDPVVIAAEPLPLAGDRLVSRSMDNRLGAYVALEVAAPLPRARRAARRASPPSPPCRRRSASSAPAPPPSSCAPTIAVAVDVTHATDAPGVDEKEIGSHPLGSGPVIGRGSTLSPKVFELLVETAEARGHRAHDRGHRAAAPAPTPTPIQISRAGIPTGLVSIPLRYMHSPVELVDLRDVEATVELLVAFATVDRPATSTSPASRPRAGPRTGCRSRPSRPRRARGPRSPSRTSSSLNSPSSPTLGTSSA